jgi:hypothetical protein
MGCERTRGTALLALVEGTNDQPASAPYSSQERPRLLVSLICMRTCARVRLEGIQTGDAVDTDATPAARMSVLLTKLCREHPGTLMQASQAMLCSPVLQSRSPALHAQLHSQPQAERQTKRLKGAMPAPDSGSP